MDSRWRRSLSPIQATKELYNVLEDSNDDEFEGSGDMASLSSSLSLSRVDGGGGDHEKKQVLPRIPKYIFDSSSKDRLYGQLQKRGVSRAGGSRRGRTAWGATEAVEGADTDAQIDSLKLGSGLDKGKDRGAVLDGHLPPASPSSPASASASFSASSTSSLYSPHSPLLASPQSRKELWGGNGWSSGGFETASATIAPASPVGVTSSPSYTSSPTYSSPLHPSASASPSSSPSHSFLLSPPHHGHNAHAGKSGGGGSGAGSPAMQRIGSLLQRTQYLAAQQESLQRDESLARLQLMHHAETMISSLPLRYLFSKPQLRHYAIERASKPLVKLAYLRARILLRKAFDVWRVPPAVKMNDQQVGFMVIAAGLANLFQKIVRARFLHWVHLSRAAGGHLARCNAAAVKIQLWFCKKRQESRGTFQMLLVAIKMCMQRRQAIKHTIKFEMARRHALVKMLRAIVCRRRHHYAARSMSRVYRWTLLLEKTTWKLTRVCAVRKLQRWRRMLQCRPARELFLIKSVIRYGGYSVVKPKVPAGHLSRGLLEGVSACAAQIQKAWYASCGKMALYILQAAKRARAEYDAMINGNATIIQSNYRAHLWNRLLLAAVQHNRARRIQFAFRHYQYRSWVWHRLQVLRQQSARRLQRFARSWLWKRFLRRQFILRKAVLIFTRAKKTLSCMVIQRAYRGHLAWLAYKRELLRQFIAAQRKQADVVMKSISRIQRNWRQLKSNRFPRHVYLVMWRIRAASRSKLYNAASRIQKRARIYIEKQKSLRVIVNRKAANKIWRVAKAYRLRLALWDRVMATAQRQRIASNRMKKNFRCLLFWRILKSRCRVRSAIRAYAQLRQDAARYMQFWLQRKIMEYNLPVRVAGRRQLKKRRENEINRRWLARRVKAAPFITRFFRGIVRWAKFLRRANVDRIWYFRRKSCKKIQKFARMVIAWGRFDRIAAYRRKRILIDQERALQLNACNVIGHYWKRKIEKLSLFVRFKNRRKMIDEWNRLEALRIQADKERDEAYEEVRITEENMRATINASWKQGSDTNGRNYYYNYVTGETSWFPPEGWKTPNHVDKWIQQKDDRGNIYYYNMHSQESSWLPPCNTCGNQAERWCFDCNLSYCERDYEKLHNAEEDEDMAKHTWALTQVERENLKPGDIYCLECKRRVAKRMCLECWDAYCDECFRYTHASGALKYHKTAAYRKIKSGWMCIKGKLPGESDYYLNGQTGETTYEKPYELMSTDEKLYYDNFQAHKKAADDYIKTIEKLQYDLESASFERDSILQDALAQGFTGGAVGNILAKRAKKNKGMFGGDEELPPSDAIAEAIRKNKPGWFSFIFGDHTEYRSKNLHPDDRRRGQAKSEYISGLLQELKDGKDTKKKAGK